MRVERDDRFVCEAGHPLYKYFLGRSEGHMLLCKSCDAAEIQGLQEEERVIEKAVQHLLAFSAPTPTPAPNRPTSKTYGSADGHRALLACGAAENTAHNLANVVADEANIAARIGNSERDQMCRSGERPQNP